MRTEDFQVGDTISVKMHPTQRKGQKLLPTWANVETVTWVGNRGVVKVETPKGGTKIYNPKLLKH